MIKQYGIEVLPKPTAMISDEMYDLIIRHYGGLPIGTIFQNEEAKAPKPKSVKEIKLEIVEDQILTVKPKKLEVESPNSNIIAERKTGDAEADKICDKNSVISEAEISNLTKVIAVIPEKGKDQVVSRSNTKSVAKSKSYYFKYIDCPNCKGIGGYDNCPGCLGSGSVRVKYRGDPDEKEIVVDREVARIKERVSLILNNNQWNDRIETQIEEDYKSILGRSSTPQIDHLLETIQRIRSNGYRSKLLKLLSPRVKGMKSNVVTFAGPRRLESECELFSAAGGYMIVRRQSPYNLHYLKTTDFIDLMKYYEASAPIILENSIVKLTNYDLESKIRDFNQGEYYSLVLKRKGMLKQMFIEKSVLWTLTDAFQKHLNEAEKS